MLQLDRASALEGRHVTICGEAGWIPKSYRLLHAQLVLKGHPGDLACAAPLSFLAYVCYVDSRLGSIILCLHYQAHQVWFDAASERLGSSEHLRSMVGPAFLDPAVMAAMAVPATARHAARLAGACHVPHSLCIADLHARCGS